MIKIISPNVAKCFRCMQLFSVGRRSSRWQIRRGSFKADKTEHGKLRAKLGILLTINNNKNNNYNDDDHNNDDSKSKTIKRVKLSTVKGIVVVSAFLNYGGKQSTVITINSEKLL